LELNTDVVDTGERSVHITNHYDIYYEDIRVATLKVTSEDHFQGTIQGSTIYTIDAFPKPIIEALERYHLNNLKDYLFNSFKLDINSLTIKTLSSTARITNTHGGQILDIRKKYTLQYDTIRFGEVSFTGNFVIKDGKTQGSMKHRYDLATRQFERKKRAKISL
jgi:hypothetical protein